MPTKQRSLVPHGGNDVVYTPVELAKQIIDSLDIPVTDSILEPCRGDSAFYNQFPNPQKFYCEIQEGVDFLQYDKHVDWIVTNPPWSLFKEFLEHSLVLAENVVFLVTINHFMTKARLRLIKEAEFGIVSITCVDTPKTFPQSGFQLGVVHLKHGHNGPIQWNWRI